MNVTGLLNKVEEVVSAYNFIGDGKLFLDLHIIDDTVVGFYKTIEIKYNNIKNEEISYLFPTTFRWLNGKLHTTIVFGSVDRHFIIPSIDHLYTKYGMKLSTMNVSNHLYKLLIATQYIENEEDENIVNGFELKSIVNVISYLNEIGFPFMRITNNTSIKLENSYSEAKL